MILGLPLVLSINCWENAVNKFRSQPIKVDNKLEKQRWDEIDPLRFEHKSFSSNLGLESNGLE